MRYKIFPEITLTDYEYVMLSVTMQLLHPFSHIFSGKIHWVKREIFFLVHVIYVGPHGLQGDVSYGVILHDFFQF
jgi:hypothetical protein